MRVISFDSRTVARTIWISLLYLLVGSARADEVAVAAQSMPASAVEMTNSDLTQPAKPFCRPTVDHSKLILNDGKLLAAGGMAMTAEQPDHRLEGSSELWDPATGQWQVLGDDLHFDSNQEVYLGQLGDGRVLFFAVREQYERGKPEYEARRWNPVSLTVEKLSVSVKPRNKSDIVMMPDGRVLIVNGNDASAEVWDSQSGLTTHSEVPELENLRWRAISLKNKKLLLMATFPDGEVVSRKKADSSAVLLFDINNGTWTTLPDLPIPFKKSNALAELENGAVYADGYILATPQGNWEWKGYVDEPSLTLDCIGNASANMSQMNAASNVAPAPRPIMSVNTIEDAWWVPYQKVVKEQASTAIVLLILLTVFHELSNRKGLSATFSTVMKRATQVWAFIFIVYIILLGLYAYERDQLNMRASSCIPKFPPPPEKSSSLSFSQQVAECASKDLGIGESLVFNAVMGKVRSLPSVPCKYVGEWRSVRPNLIYRVTLTDDSQFRAEYQPVSSIILLPPPPKSITGSWGAAGDEMLWFNDKNSSSNALERILPDVNKILQQTPNHFELVEEDGSRTTFELITRFPSGACKL